MTWNAGNLVEGLGDLDLDFQGANGIFLAFPREMDHALDLNFGIEDYGHPTALLKKIFPARTKGSDFFFSFSEFSNPDALSSANSIRMTINSTTDDLDASLDLVESRDAPPVSIPEPATMGLLCFGLLGLGYRRWKAKVHNA